MQALHLVTDHDTPPSLAPAGDTWQTQLRPTSFDCYVGQKATIATLRTAVAAARIGRWALDHVLVSGPAGLGKTSLAAVIANELDARLVATSAPSITHKGELAALLTSLEAGDVLFIDEIHRLPVPLQEVLYAAMEDYKVDLFTGGKNARSGKAITVPLPKFTLVGATTHAGMLTGPMRDRFGFSCQLRPYEVAELASIIARSAEILGVAIDPAGCEEIARRSRGTPRIANKLLRRVRDTATMAAYSGALVPFGRPVPAAVATVNLPVAAAALDALGIDAAGLDAVDRAYLGELVAAGAPVGIAALAANLGEPRATLEETVEPFLLALGFIARTGRGRIATAAGRAHLESA
jgi:holliday junction DNA helicase RuvB